MYRSAVGNTRWTRGRSSMVKAARGDRQGIEAQFASRGCMELVDAPHGECAVDRNYRATTRSEYASNLAQRALAIPDVVEHARAEHPIKRGVAERQGLGVCLAQQWRRL